MNFSYIFDSVITTILFISASVIFTAVAVYFITKGFMLGFYEAKLFFKKKLKESNDEKKPVLWPYLTERGTYYSDMHK